MAKREAADIRDIGLHYYVKPDEDEDCALVFCPHTEQRARIVYLHPECAEGVCEDCETVLKREVRHG